MLNDAQFNLGYVYFENLSIPKVARLEVSFGSYEPPIIFRAVPFEKLVGGCLTSVGFSDLLAAIFHFFLGYPAAIFFPFTQCKMRPIRSPRSDFRTILRPPCSIF